jgi:hypothetical protein
MTAALSGEQRSALEKLVQSARRGIEVDLEKTLEGKFGINSSGEIESADRLSLTNAGHAVRADLVEIVEYLRAEGEGPIESVARLIREAAFTHTNRLIAVRVAEAIGLLPETMARGVASKGFKDFSELAPTIAATEWGRFAEFIRLCADELAADVPALFDPRNPLIELAVSETVLTQVVEAMALLETDLWAAPDTLGWAYQFFNTGEERKEMRESSAPRNSRELAVRNQFFTPSYVVEFLVHNGLGAHLAAGMPGLADELPFLVEVPSEHVDVDLEAVSVLDPACGSGHFLLGAYDVLEKAWARAGVEAGAAAPAIVRSLWGIDIDPRATQIAQAAVMFRARRHCKDEKLPKPNVICARALPAGAEVDALIASLSEHVGRAVRGIASELVDAPVLGPLLKIEDRLSREVRDVFGAGEVEGTLSELARDPGENVEAAVLEALSAAADATTSSAAQRLFAAEAHDAVRFVEAMARRYTAVLMNPPFGSAVPETRTYLNAAYGAAAADLYAAFVSRGTELLESCGSLGAITNRTGFFLSSLEEWRRGLLQSGVRCFADLGSFVLEGAQVEVAAYVIGGDSKVTRATFLRAVLSRDKERVLRRRPSELTFAVDPKLFAALPGAWFDYWAGDELLGLFDTAPALEAGGRQVSRGISAGDNFRFLRLWWELDASAEERGWVPLSKGGEFRRFFDEARLRIDWRSGADPYGAVPGARIFNLDLQGRPGVCWPKRTTSLPSARPLPGSTMFEANSIPLFGPDLEILLSFANSRIFAFLFLLQVGAADIARGSAAKDWITGPARRIPYVAPGEEASSRLRALAVRGHHAARELASWVETSVLFSAPPVVALMRDGREWADAIESLSRERDELEVTLLEIECEADNLWIEAYQCSPESIDIMERELEPLVCGYPPGPPTSAAFDQAYLSRAPVAVDRDPENVRNLARAAAQTADRSLRDLSHLFAVHPRAIGEARSEHRLIRSDDAAAIAFGLISYLVGDAFGRWVEQGPEEILGSPFDPLPMPRVRGSESTSWTEGPSVMVDQSGHERDLTACVQRACRRLLGGNEVPQEALDCLGARGSLTRLLRSAFFNQHLSMYSMSRRRAPIYWQLQVPSKSWGLWLYAPRLSREMLFAIVRETEQRQRLAEQQITHLQREAESGSGGRLASAVAKELDAEQRLAVELESFRAEAERIANLGWEPDLDDGMALNAAPLADLFPAWKDAASYRKELRAGKYEWATAANFADQL